MNYCPHCHFSFQKELPGASRESLHFCPNCGGKLDGFPGSSMGDSEVVKEHIIQLLRENRYIEAVKYMRESKALGLKESKQAVDAVADQYNLLPALPKVSKMFQIVICVFISVFAGLMISSAGIAVYPKLGLVSSPFLCDGDLSIKSYKLYSLPGEGVNRTGVSRTFQCSGGRDVTFQVFLVSTLVYSALLFPIVCMWRFLKTVKRR